MDEARNQKPAVPSGSQARSLLVSLGLPASPLVASDGWSNQVWLGPSHVVRFSSGRFRDSFAHEAAVLHMLPRGVPHARVAARGRSGEREWLVLERVAGNPLTTAWHQLGRTHRREVARQLGELLRALHRIPLPAGFRNPWIEDALAPGGDRRDAYHAPPESYGLLLDAARAVPGVDGAVLDDVGSFIVERLDAFANESMALVHADVHFANLMWDQGRVTALLDFESARPAPPDLELDTLARFVREPEVFCDRSDPAGLTRVDLADFLDWLAGAYPELFSHSRLGARLAVYEAVWQLVQLLHFPPGSGRPDPWGHLTALVDKGDRWNWR